MKKITRNLLAAGILFTAGMLTSCSSETTTGVDTGNTNTENAETDMNESMTDTTTTDMDTTNQNPPTGNTGNQDQQ